MGDFMHYIGWIYIPIQPLVNNPPLILGIAGVLWILNRITYTKSMGNAMLIWIFFAASDAYATWMGTKRLDVLIFTPILYLVTLIALKDFVTKLCRREG